MYWPCLVLPYHSSPSLWKTLVLVLTHTLPPPPPGACGMVDGSTGSALGFTLAAFLSDFEVFGALAGAVWARHIVDIAPINTASRSNRSFRIFKCSSLASLNSKFDLAVQASAIIHSRFQFLTSTPVHHSTDHRLNHPPTDR